MESHGCAEEQPELDAVSPDFADAGVNEVGPRNSRIDDFVRNPGVALRFR